MVEKTRREKQGLNTCAEGVFEWREQNKTYVCTGACCACCLLGQGIADKSRTWEIRRPLWLLGVWDREESEGRASSALQATTQGSSRLLKAAPGCSRPLKAAQGCSRPLKAAQGRSRPLTAAHGCSRTFMAEKVRRIHARCCFAQLRCISIIDDASNHADGIHAYKHLHHMQLNWHKQFATKVCPYILCVTINTCIYIYIYIIYIYTYINIYN